MPESQKVTTFLWFDDNAEEAIEYYTSIFANSQILSACRSSPGGPLLTATFELDGQQFMALNGGPMYKFNEAISLFVRCETQEEVDELWEKLSAGGAPGRCGWLKDRFGMSWQIIPNALGQLMSDPDPQKSKRAMAEMFQMGKIDIAALRAAYNGE